MFESCGVQAEEGISEANLSNANLAVANLSGANISGARLVGASLSEAVLFAADLKGTKPEEARSLTNTDLRGVKGLTQEQLEACKAKGAIIDEDSPTSSSQPAVSPPPPSQSNDAQTPSAPPAQGNTPTPDTSGSSGASSSQPGPES